MNGILVGVHKRVQATHTKRGLTSGADTVKDTFNLKHKTSKGIDQIGSISKEHNHTKAYPIKRVPNPCTVFEEYRNIPAWVGKWFDMKHKGDTGNIR